MKHVITLLAALFVFAPFAAHASTIDDGEKAATVIIQVNDSGAHGTGFAIASSNGVTTIVTAKHVVNDITKPTIIDAAGHVHAFIDSSIDAQYDIATIHVAGSIPVVSLGQFGAIGENVETIGHPGTHAYVRSAATVVYHYAAGETDHALDYVVQCPSCDHGDSGAAIFDANGYALGVVSSVQVINGKETGYFFIVPMGVSTLALK